MSDVASLSVALHLNSAAFKSQITDAYQTAGRAGKNFTDKATNQANELANAIARTGEAARKIGNTTSSAAGFNGIIRGAGQLNFVLHEVAAGSNVASSTIINALIPAVHSLKGQLDSSTGGWKAQQDAAKAAAAELMDAATQQIKIAQTEKQAAASRAAIAEKTIAAAQAQREHAIALDEYYAKQAEVNKLYGVTVSYQEEHAKNERAIVEANKAEAAALDKLKAAQAAATAADVAETEGKAALATATEAATVASTELTAAQRIAATSSKALQTALGLLGGPVGLGLSVIAAGGTLIYHAFQSASEEAKTLNAALMSSKAAGGITVSTLSRLNSELGGTKESLSAVSEAVKAGFSGDMLDEIAATGTQLEQLGGSASDFVNQLSNLKGDPLKAMRELTAQGVLLDTEFIKHIITLKNQGNTSQATAELQKKANDAVKAKIKQNTDEIKTQNSEIQGLAISWRGVGVAAGEAGLAQQQAAQVHAAKKSLEQDNERQKKQQDEINKQLDEQNKKLNQQATFEHYTEASITREQQRAKALKEVNEAGKALGKTEAEIAAARRGVEAQFATPKKSGSGVSEGQRLLQQAQQRQAVLKAQAETTKNLTSSEQQLIAFDQKIANLKGQHLTASQQSLVNMQDQIRSQLQINAQLEREAELRKLSAKYEKETASWQAEAAALRAEGDHANDSLKMSQREQDNQQAELEIRNRFAVRKTKLDQDYTDHSSEEYKKRLSQLQQYQDQELATVRNTAQDKLAAESDYTAGFKRGTKDWLDSSRDVNSQMAGFASDTFDSMTDALTSFVTTGKMNFRSFTTSILSDLAKIAMRMALTNTVSGIFGSFVASAKGNVFSSPGLSAYSNSIVSSPTLFAFANGAGLMGEAGPEAVMPLTRGPDGSLGVRASGSGSGSTVINVNAPVTISNDNGGGAISATNTASTARQLKSIVETAITDRLRREMSPGGVLYSR